MAQYCEICGKMTNCTDNCVECLKEEQSKELLDDLKLEQREQM